MFLIFDPLKLSFFLKGPKIGFSNLKNAPGLFCQEHCSYLNSTFEVINLGFYNFSLMFLIFAKSQPRNVLKMFLIFRESEPNVLINMFL